MSYIYTAIGDSLTTGFGALPGNGFVPVYRRMTENGLRTPIYLNNLGANGLDSEGLEQRLRHHPVYRQAIRDADLITLSIGGNDLIHAAREVRRNPARESYILNQSLAECKSNFGSIIRMIYTIKESSRSPYILRVVGLYNPYPQISEANSWVGSFNRYAAQYSSRVYGFADIFSAFAERGRELLSIDQVHPNGKGYRIIAEQLNGLGYGFL
ncbi:GDSL-type esterase/lipase family protein [Paenibacillus sp. YPG26]|uniref:GDSL-type esterase/lipase family protein n=1 Tax=Paenibacillus sp. YPG26 TaxID=2878915 RepID=UPI00203CD4C6|nr:GDSL-type esterase/lipase family protein [Paenibacillus sp. YPG26]USB33477.1 GDSL-type esterase/lipase family protein [Paenibacillus sp. YPG26]